MINIATFNVRGIAAYEKRSKIFKFLKSSVHDVIALQECHSSKRFEKLWRAQFGGQAFYSHGSTNARGCMILIKRHIQTKIHRISKDSSEGRFLMVELTIDNYRMVICNVYAPNEDKVEFFEHILKKMLEFNADSYVLLGDMNTTLQIIDKECSNDCKPGHPKCTDYIHMMLEKLNLIDIWRERNMNNRRFTWFKTKPRLLMERLDYIFISNNLSSYIMSTDIDPTFMSDHAIPHISLQDVAGATKGPGFWKLNIAHLQDNEFKMLIRDTLSDSLNQFDDSRVGWDFFKMKFRGEAIKYGARKKKARNNKLEVLQNKLYKMQNEKDKCKSVSMFNDVEEHMSLLQKEIQEIIQQKAMSSSFTNQVNWYMAGEKSSHYFFALENKFPRKPLLRIEIDGKIINDTDEVLCQLKNFYGRLFTKVEGIADDEAFISDLQLPQVTEDDRSLLEEPISLQEVEIAIKQLNKQKCPGLDGIPIELYQEMIEDIKHPVHNVILKSIREKELSNSAKKGIISLLEKSGKDQLKINSWHPLSLLGCDFKIFTKILANRLSIVTPYIIHEDQSGFLKNRYIAQNLVNLSTVMEVANKEKMEAVIVAIDFEKAYDTVNWRALYLTLRAFGFGPNFIDMIKVSQQNIESAIINNGNRSDFFDISRGLRQGCPLSCLLFDCIVEILGAKIRASEEIEGIPCDGTVVKKLEQYADDIWVSMKHKKSCYQALFKILHDFAKFSGLKANYDKTEVLRIGSLRLSDARFYSDFPLQWTDGPIKILGIWCTSDPDLMLKINFEKTLDKAANICKIWSKRPLTILGKILLVNTLIVPLFTYRLSIIRTPTNKDFSDYKKLVTAFIWDKKKPRIAYSRLIRDFDQGGLRLADLECKNIALKTKWMQVARFQGNTLWGKTVSCSLNMECNDIAECNINIKDVKAVIQPSMFRDVMTAWCRINFRTPTSQGDVLDQVLRYNSHIKCGGKLMFLDKWYRSGVVKMKHIWREDRFKTIVELREEFGKEINIIDASRVINAIPKEWKILIKKKVETVVDSSAIDKVRNLTKCTKIVYDFLISRMINDSKARLKWESELDLELYDPLWGNLYRDVVKLTLSTKLRCFQYRIINRYLVTNVIISKWHENIKADCTFCNQEIETIRHLLVDCESVKKLWSTLKTWLNHFCALTINLTPYEIIFNKYKGAFAPLVNTLILITKYYIYVQRCLNKKLNFYELITAIEKYKKVEFVVAWKENKLKKCRYKWCLYDMI